MEMNTRIQVEHTVTEELTGVDLVKEQLLIALGHPLSVRQKEITFEGHIMQFRINAEDPSRNFSPSPGKIFYFVVPGGPHVRVDTACYSGYTIPPYYDSMIAKVIVKGKTRAEAMARAKRCLRELHIGGVAHTGPFHLYMLDDPAFAGGKDYDLTYIDGLMAQGCSFTKTEGGEK
jgi:acetyl-CoA carboxylase biotin carboxylase subunit